MAEDYWHAGRRFLVPLLLLLFSVCVSAQRTLSSSGKCCQRFNVFRRCFNVFLFFFF